MYFDRFHPNTKGCDALAKISLTYIEQNEQKHYPDELF